MDKNIIEKYLKDDRWYVKLQLPLNGKTCMPQATYVWLIGNPIFEDIPQGYVIHHLDHDQLNDDISNLALMQKHHHIAHHFKQKIILPTLKIDPRYFGVERTAYSPISKPVLKVRKPSGRCQVRIRERIGDEIKTTHISSFMGKRFETKEQAQAFVDTIWPTRSL